MYRLLQSKKGEWVTHAEYWKVDSSRDDAIIVGVNSETLMQSGATDAVFNVASGSETSLLGLWRTLQRVTGAYHLEPEFLPARAVNNVVRRLGDTTRAADQLRFRAKVHLEAGIRRLVEWRQKSLHPAEEMHA